MGYPTEGVQNHIRLHRLVSAGGAARKIGANTAERLSALLDDPRIEGALCSLVGPDWNYTGGDGNWYSGDTSWHSDG